MLLQMLALSVLDSIMAEDKFQQWLSFLVTKGYLQHLVDSLPLDDSGLHAALAPVPSQLRPLYIFQSKMVKKRLLFFSCMCKRGKCQLQWCFLKSDFDLFSPFKHIFHCSLAFLCTHSCLSLLIYWPKLMEGTQAYNTMGAV